MSVIVTTPATTAMPRAKAVAVAGPLAVSTRRLGVWSAILTSIFSAGWLVTWIWQMVAAPTAWEGPEAAAADFQFLHILHLYPSILLAPTFVVLLACLYLYAPRDRKVWALSALAIGVVYATMATINYNVQLVGVRMSLEAGESAGLEMFLQANPRSMFASLANAYVYMALAMFLVAFVFGGGRLSQTVKGLFLVAGLQVPLQFWWSVTSDGTPSVLALLAVVAWILGAVVATPLVAVLFHRTLRDPDS